MGEGRGGAGLRPGASLLWGLAAGPVTLTFAPTKDPHLGFLWSCPQAPGRGEPGRDSGVRLAAEGTRVLGVVSHPLRWGPPPGTA